MAAGSVLVSEMPALAAWPVALAAAAWGARLAVLELRRPARQWVIPAGPGAASVDGEDVESLQVHWRGPLATLVWRDARQQMQRLHGWPDTLPAPVRRELRLAMLARAPARPLGSMAP